MQRFLDAHGLRFCTFILRFFSFVFGGENYIRRRLFRLFRNFAKIFLTTSKEDLQMLKTKIFLLLVICFAAANSALAWDDVGHKTIAYIAWQKMTPQAREQAIKLLRSAPEDSNLAAYFMGDARPLAVRQMDYFMLSATWADIVRDRDFKTRYKKYHHGPWHYLDTFWRTGADGKPEVITDMENDKENAVERLFYFDKVLRDSSASSENRALALAWIMHIAGDIHQPQHASGRVTPEEPKGDQGGNLFLLTPQGTPRDKSENLHWFWDSIIVRNIPRGETGDTQFIPSIAKKITKKYPESKFSNRLDLGKFDGWQQESFRIASTKLYPASLKEYQMPSPAYKKMALQISEEQIALAGYRLGAMLNQILGAQSAQEMTRKEIEQGGSKIGQGANDSWLWFKTKAALATTDDLRESTINLDVENDVVTLKGSVKTIAQKMKAEQVAKNIDGVKAIKNEIKVSQ
jgi:osmotically-inducible protein OsmY